jgi:hypothetical protein
MYAKCNSFLLKNVMNVSLDGIAVSKRVSSYEIDFDVNVTRDTPSIKMDDIATVHSDF